MPSGQRRALDPYYYAPQRMSNRDCHGVASQKLAPIVQGRCESYGNLVLQALSSESFARECSTGTRLLASSGGSLTAIVSI